MPPMKGQQRPRQMHYGTDGEGATACGRDLTGPLLSRPDATLRPGLVTCRRCIAELAKADREKPEG